MGLPIPLLGTEHVIPAGSSLVSSPPEISTSQHHGSSVCLPPRRPTDTIELHTPLIRQRLLPQGSSPMPSKLTSENVLVKSTRSLGPTKLEGPVMAAANKVAVAVAANFV